MTVAHIGLGSNLGDRRRHLAAAIRGLADMGTLLAVSPLYETAPVGGIPQPPYLNAVALVETGLEAPALLRRLHEAEQGAGRRRDVRWGARTLDLDLLTFGALSYHTSVLQIPHAEAHRRAFVLAPWMDVAPRTFLYGRPLSYWWARRPPDSVILWESGAWWVQAGDHWAAQRLAPGLGHGLREQGVRTVIRPGGLLQVMDGPGLLTAEALRRAGVGEPWRWAAYARVDTTMRVAGELLAAGGKPVAVVAESQDAGRGRRGRAWEGLDGGSLLISFGWEPEPHELSGPLTLIAGVAAVRAVKETTGVYLRLKWPNDGLLGGGKCLGILAEAQRGTPPRLVVGFGLNVNGAAERLPEGAATLESHTGQPWPRAALAAALGRALGDVLDEWRAAGGVAIRLLDEWRLDDLTLGRAVTISTREGESFPAHAEAVRDDGALIVRHRDTGLRETVVAADVSLRFAPR